MVRTIFDRIRPSELEASTLLMGCLQMALRDLLDREYLEWHRPLPEDVTVLWTGTAARQNPLRQGFRRLRRFPTDRALERAFDDCEELFDKHNLDEDERDTLFTALPCLGLLALDDLLTWNKKPPFPEVN